MALTDPFNLLLILGIIAVIVIWGPSKIPQLARSLGQARKEFERGSTESGQGAGTTSSSEQEKLERAAKELGINPSGLTEQQLREEIQRVLMK